MNDETTTPLDLLLNAITGSSDFAYTAHAGGDVARSDEELDITSILAAHAQAEGPSAAGRTQPLDETVDKLRQQKIAKTLSAQILLAAKRGAQGEEHHTGQARLDDVSQGIMSKVEVWHPKTGQKSYGKERRILCPPPILNVSGPLFSLLTSATLSTTSQSEASDTPIASSTQTQRIPVSHLDDSNAAGANGEPSKKHAKEARRRKLREAALRAGFGATLAMDRSKDMPKQRKALADGLGFAGMWIGEEKGKGKSRGKEYHLELTLSQPGVEDTGFPSPSQQAQGEAGPSEALPQMVDDQISPDDAAALRDVFGQANLDELQAFEDGLVNHTSDLVEHLPEQPQTISELEKKGSTSTPLEVDMPSHLHSWATFTSAPLAVVTKPSQKTIKARSMASCLSDRDIISLYTRLHSQTVRTKYMKLEAGSTPQLTSKTGKWSPFAIEIVSRASLPISGGRPAKRTKTINAEQPEDILTYGSVIRLTDMKTGIKTDPLRLVKVEKNEAVVGEDYGQPVSELQRVGLARADGDEESARWFLSAPGARMGGGELRPEMELQRTNRPKAKKETATEHGIAPQGLGEVGVDSLSRLEGDVGRGSSADFDKFTTLHDQAAAADSLGETDVLNDEDTGPTSMATKRKRTKRNALAKAAVEEEEEGSSAALLGWAQARRQTRDVSVNEDGVMSTRSVYVEKIEDWMCWLIAGVSSFSFSVFDGYSGFGTLPSASLDPIPRVLADPQLVAESNTLHLVLSDFYFADEFDTPRPLEVYLGPIGPLAASAWRSTARPPQESPSSEKPPLAVPYDQGEGEFRPDHELRSSFPSTTKHVLVVVEMPDAQSILRVMEEFAAQIRQDASGDPGQDSQTGLGAGTQGEHGEQVHVEVGVQDNDNDNDQDNHGGNVAGAAGESWDAADAEHAIPVHGELTIQQALQNAQAAQASLDLDSSMIDPDIAGQPDTREPKSFPGSASPANAAASQQVFHDDTDIHSHNHNDSHNHNSEDTANGTGNNHDAGGGGGIGIGGGIGGEGGGGDEDDAGVGKDRLGMGNGAQGQPPPPIGLYVPERQRKAELVALPLVLIRRRDGAGFGVGRSVVAERLEGERVWRGNAHWGLRLVDA